MKRGILWFLYLDKALYGTGFAMMLLIALGFFIKMDSMLYLFMWILRGVCLLLLVLLFVLRIPTSKSMSRLIESCDDGFEERQKKVFSEKHRQVKFLKLRCYAKGKGMKLSRVLDNRVIYGNLVLLGVVTALDGKWLIQETYSLYKGSSRNVSVYFIEDESKISVKKTEGRDENCKLVIQGGNVMIHVIAHDDYHLNDFVTALKQSHG